MSERPAPLLDRWLAPLLHDAALWPVTFVLVAHGVLAVGVTVLDVWRTGPGWGLVGAGVIAVASLAAWISDARRRRLGVTSGLFAFSWVVGLVGAWAADRSGVY